MAATIQFELATPAALQISEAVEMVEVPGEMGDFGVLPGHAPLMSMIRPGVVTVHTENEKRRFFVTAGYAVVSPEECVVLAEHLYDMAEMTKEKAMSERDAVLAVLPHATEEADKERLQKQIVSFDALIEAII